MVRDQMEELEKELFKLKRELSDKSNKIRVSSPCVTVCGTADVILCCRTYRIPWRLLIKSEMTYRASWTMNWMQTSSVKPFCSNTDSALRSSLLLWVSETPS
jgi:hypothetical protein